MNSRKRVWLVGFVAVCCNADLKIHVDVCPRVDEKFMRCNVEGENGGRRHNVIIRGINCDKRP